MTIVGPLPFTLVNGVTADGSQVNANFEALIGDINTNAQPANTGNAIYSGAVAYSSAISSALSNGVFSSIPLTGEYFDTASIHDNITNNSRMTVPAGVSVVRLVGNILLAGAGGAGNTFNVGFRKNGNNSLVYAPTGPLPAGATYSNQISITSFALQVVPGNYFEMVVFSGLGTNTYTGPTLEMQILG